MIIKYFRRTRSVDPTGHEPTDASGAEFAETCERLEDFATGLVIAFTYADTPQKKFRLYKTQAVRILAEIQRFENWQRTQERLRSSEKTNGCAPQNAEEQIDPYLSPPPGEPFMTHGVTTKVLTFPGGRQLSFNMVCMNCHFQCWECPSCDCVRCSCKSCGCDLEKATEQV